MFEFLKKKDLFDKDKVAELLQMSPQALEKFEKAYAVNALDVSSSDNLFDINAKMAAEQKAGIVIIPENVEKMIEEIVDDLVLKTYVYSTNTKYTYEQLPQKTSECVITNDDIKALPVELRPQLTGNMMKVDIETPSYLTLCDNYSRYLKDKDSAKGKQFYHMFRQGLDILDLDPITYEMIGMNPNSMGYWLPKLMNGVKYQTFFKVPETTIIKVPMTLLQLTRQDYMELTTTTMEIVNRYCRRVFGLDLEKEYFIKTGTYSSKFDFRNAHVKGPKEVSELGEYLLFIHFQALQMASPLASPCIYGVSTTNEWVVREFIKDKENNPWIYKGMPLHTEYRVFVDFDSKRVIGKNPYWDPDVMKQRFGHEEDADSPHNIHDYIIYKAHEETLMKRYNENADMVVEGLEKMLPDIDLHGQWSIDVMQNGDDFWIIDMALAENSAFYDCVPKELRNPTEENWIPKLERL